MTQVLTISVNINQSERTAIDWLVKTCPDISKQKLKQAMQFGAVWLTEKGQTRRIRRAKKQLNPGCELHLYFNHETLFTPITPAQLVADEGDFSVWNKPCGMFSQGTKWGDHSSICRWIELQGFKLNGLKERPVFLVHRLDRATSGLIVVAHSKKVAATLAGLFEKRQVNKHYQAIIKGRLTGLKVNQRIEQAIDGKSASTLLLSESYDLIKDQSLLTLKLETGRKHQIRKHLASLGYPIIGDRLYAENGQNSCVDKLTPDLQLTSILLSFDYQAETKTYQL